MTTFIDQTGERLQLKETPKRIISIVPSQSEFLWDIGLRSELVGITKFCIHPNEMFINVERVGGTKTLNLDVIRTLKPDLIIGNKEENEKAQIDELRKEFNVWMSDIFTIDNALQMMMAIGEMAGKTSEARKLVSDIEIQLLSIKNIFQSQRVAYFIWNKPYMLAAENTYINYILNYVGLSNVASHLNRYPEVSIEQLKQLNPDWCLLSSEPFPFKQKHCREIEKNLSETKAMVVDGEMFSWYGSRLQKLPEYILDLKNKLL